MKHFFKFDIVEFVFQKFLFSGVCLVRSLSCQVCLSGVWISGVCLLGVWISGVCLSGVRTFRSLSFRSLSFRSLSFKTLSWHQLLFSRITSICWHPTKPGLACVGSKWGDLVLWDVFKDLFEDKIRQIFFLSFFPSL